MTILINALVNYTAQCRYARGRIFRPAFLSAEQPVVIREISASQAPVGYRIDSGIALFEPFEVRLDGGSLFWPLHGDHGALRSEELVAFAKTDWERANAVLDPLGRTYTSFRETFDGHFGENLPKEWHSDLETQCRQVRADAARLLSIDGIMHVDAGEPVWFAVHNRETRHTFDLVVGPSSLDRRDHRGCHMPCVDRGTRLTSARLGRAFGLDELDEELLRLPADAVYRTSRIEPTGIHRAGPAAQVCAVAWAQNLWEVAWRYPELRRLISAVANAEHRSPPPEVLHFAQMLEAFVKLHETGPMLGLPPCFAEAELILERLGRAGYAESDEDTEAISLLRDLSQTQQIRLRNSDRGGSTPTNGAS